MANDNSKDQSRYILQNTDKQISTLRKTMDKGINNSSVTKMLKVYEDISDTIKDSTDSLSNQHKQLQELDNLLASLNTKAAISTGEQKAQYENEINQVTKRKELLESLTTETELRLSTAKAAAEQVKDMTGQYNISREMLDTAKASIDAKEKEAELANQIAEAEKQAKYYSVENHAAVEENIKKERESLKDLKKQYDDLSESDKKSEKGKALGNQIKGLTDKIKSDSAESKKIYSGLTSKEKETVNESHKEKDPLKEISGSFSELGSTLKDGFKNTFSSLTNLGSAITNAVAASRKYFNTIVDGATQTVASYYGPIAASLEGVNGTITDFKSLNSRVQLDVGLSSMIKQETLLGNINELVNQGITSDIESIGILKTIKDKTVSSFNATDANLRRLVRLNQSRGNLTAKQFGLADALKESFNATFGDHTYLNDMFQSITGTVLDAVSANANSGSTDSTAFYSVLESWLGAMYESGVDQGTINTIAQGVNYLGSGNVQGLSGNKQLQNLMLLSMDRAGLDYADILQRGLSNSDMNTLLSTIVDYLAEITSTTKENNVLQSSYANLFNLSVTDMTAIQNLSKSGFTAIALTGAGAQNKAAQEINNVSSRTSASEQIDNVIDNAKFSFGSSVAANKAAYYTYRTSNLILDMLDSLGSTGQGSTGGMVQKAVGKVFDAISGPTRLVTSIAYLASLLPGAVGFGKSIVGSATSLLNGDGNNALAEIIAQGSSGGIYDNGSSGSGVISLSSSPGSNSSNKLKQFTLSSATKSSGISDTSSWQNDAETAANEEDENTKILKELEKTLMKAKDKDGYAFAVSLQGMSDGVLRSFASIFADEEAMMNTMTGQNNALEKNNTFIDYLEDTSKTTSSNSSSTKTSTTTAKA